MSKESAQAALNMFAEAVNTGKFELFDQVVAPDCVDHDPADGQVPGPAGYRMFFSGMRTAFPDMSVTPEIIVISKFKDGKMVERWGSSDERTLLRQIGIITELV
jgi:predicted ester cyclase